MAWNDSCSAASQPGQRFVSGGRHLQAATDPLGPHDHEVSLQCDKGTFHNIGLGLGLGAQRRSLVDWEHNLESERRGIAGKNPLTRYGGLGIRMGSRLLVCPEQTRSRENSRQ